jgi:hypothetical protein
VLFAKVLERAHNGGKCAFPSAYAILEATEMVLIIVNVRSDLKERLWGLWNGFIWLRIGPSGGLLRTW